MKSVKSVITPWEVKGNVDYDKVISLYKRATDLEKKNVKNWISLAQLYEQEGEIEKAKEAAQKAIGLDPTVKDYAEDFIRGLE